MPHARVGNKVVVGPEESNDEAQPPSKPSGAIHEPKRQDSKAVRVTVVESTFVHSYTVTAPSLEPEHVELTLDVSGQHTLSWSVPFASKDTPAEQVPAGSCNLYLFPALASGTSEPLSAPQLHALRALFVAMLSEPSPLWQEPDMVGAYPIHALGVANTAEALALLEAVYEENPRLLMQVHTKHRAGFPLFTGESGLHVLAVNNREDMLCRMIELCVSKLTNDEVCTLFRSQAAGVFFNEMPMRFYGGTPLAYACVRGHCKAVKAYLDTGIVSLNDRSDACGITGFLPIHAVAANGVMSMYDWLTNELPVEQRADVEQRSSAGRMLALDVHSLVPLQLAAKLGDHAAVKHIMRKQTSIMWVWGPVTQHTIDLNFVDSGGEGGGDIMELVARMNASKETTELLLDSFMGGFLHKLFAAKWARYGYKLHYARTFLDLTILLMLILMALLLKEMPERQDSLSGLAVALLMLMAILTEEELRLIYLWWRNNQGEGDARTPTRTMVSQAWQFCMAHCVHVMLMSYACTLVSCILVLAYDLEPQPDVSNITGAAGGRRLKGGGGGGGGVVGGEVIDEGVDALGRPYQVLGSLSGYQTQVQVGDEGEVSGALWLFLSAAIFTMMPYCAFKIFTPFEKLNIFQLSVSKMLKRDLILFIVIFGVFMAQFYFSLYILYPRAGAVFLPQVLAFNNWYDALKGLIELAFTGSPSPVDLERDFAMLSTMQQVDLCFWFILYIYFVIISIILLLNLLIAMLSFTFESVREESTLQCRTAFAQCLIRLELLATSLGMDVRVGDKKGEKYTYDFRSVEADDAGSSGQGTDYDPFAIPDGGPIVRVESKVDRLEELHAGLAAKVDHLVQLLTPAAAIGGTLPEKPAAEDSPTPKWD